MVFDFGGGGFSFSPSPFTFPDPVSSPPPIFSPAPIISAPPAPVLTPPPAIPAEPVFTPSPTPLPDLAPIAAPPPPPPVVPDPGPVAPAPPVAETPVATTPPVTDPGPAATAPSDTQNPAQFETKVSQTIGDPGNPTPPQDTQTAPVLTPAPAIPADPVFTPSPTPLPDLAPVTTTAPPPVTDPAPVATAPPVTDPGPAAITPPTTDPGPVATTPPVTDPGPVATIPPVTDPAPPVTETLVTPAPPVTDPEPVATTPPVTDPGPVATTPPVTDPEPVVPAPPVAETPVTPAPPATDPGPVATTPPVTDPGPVATTPPAIDPEPVATTPPVTDPGPVATTVPVTDPAPVAPPAIPAEPVFTPSPTSSPDLAPIATSSPVAPEQGPVAANPGDTQNPAQFKTEVSQTIGDPGNPTPPQNTQTPAGANPLPPELISAFPFAPTVPGDIFNSNRPTPADPPTPAVSTTDPNTATANNSVTLPTNNATVTNPNTVSPTPSDNGTTVAQNTNQPTQENTNGPGPATDNPTQKVGDAVIVQNPTPTDPGTQQPKTLQDQVDTNQGANPFTNAVETLTNGSDGAQEAGKVITDAAQNALDYYANLTVQGQNEGGAAGLAKQTLGTIGGLLSSLATQDNLGQTAAILALPVALEAGAGTKIGSALLSNPVIAGSLNILGGIASASDLSQAISGVNAEGRQLSPAEQLAKATSGLGGGALTAGSAAPKVAEILDNLAPKLKQLGSQGTAALDAASSKLNQLLNGDAQLATAGPDSNVLKAEVQKTEGNQGPLQSRNEDPNNQQGGGGDTLLSATGDDAKTLQALSEIGVPDKQAQSLLRAANESGSSNQLRDIFLSEGKFTGVEKLDSDILGPLTSTKKDPGTLAGIRNELSEIAALRRQGKDVAYGTKQADVLNNTDKEAIQLKNVSSETLSGVKRNLVKDARQLSGVNTEVLPEGYTKVAKIRIDPELATKNPLYGASRDEAQNLIKETLSEANGKLDGKFLRDSVDEVRFINGNGTEEIFKKSNGDF